MEVTRRYTFKLYPTKAQEVALRGQATLCAQLWNAALEQREIQWAHECQSKPKGERKGLSKFDQGKELKNIRGDDPAFAALSQASLELMIESLDLAFKAFFRRAKSGAGASSGYPRYKRTDTATTIPHRDAPRGWRLHSAGKHWKLYAKGIPGLIRARGKFPAEPAEIRTMELIRRDGAWWSSIVVKMESRMMSGGTPIEVNFDLIDGFASVKNRANGECLSGLTLMEGRKPSANQSTSGISDVVACDSEGNDRISGLPRVSHCDVVACDSEGNDRCNHNQGGAWNDVVACDSEGNDRVLKPTGTVSSDVRATDRIQSERDIRFKKFSIRWRREKARIAKLKARAARQRRESLHLWTTGIIRGACDLLVVSPQIRDSIKTGRGDERNHGAAVATVALLNRHVLSQAPAAAIQMLEYKATEAGIQFTRITPDEHAIQIGRDIHLATKAVRQVRRSLKKEIQV